MSLTVPSGLQTRLPNRSENWIVQLFNSSKTHVDSNTDEQLNTNETSLDVDDGSDFNVHDIIMIHNHTEMMKVTNISSDTLTLQRRYLGTNETADIVTNRDIYKRNFIGLSFSAVVLQDQYYEPCILNMPSIRESIDLDAQTSSRSNVSIKIANFTYQGAPFSEQLHNGTNAYLNQLVRIYIPPTKITSGIEIQHCLQVYEGRLVHIAHDVDTITLEINSEEPWKDVKVPNVKHAKYNVYQPIVYGSYDYSNAASGSTRNAVFGTVFPVPVLYTTQEKVWTVMPKAYSSGSNAYLHAYTGFDQFSSWKYLTSPHYTDTTSVESNVNILGTFVHDGYISGYISTAISDKDAGAATMFNNQSNMFDVTTTGAAIDSTTASIAFTSNTHIRHVRFQTPPRKFHLTGVRTIKARMYISGLPSEATQLYDINFFSNQFAPLDDNLITGDGTQITVTSSAQEFEFTFNDEPKNVIRFRYDRNDDGDLTDSNDWYNYNYASCPDEILMKCDVKVDGFSSHTLHITDIRVGYIAHTDTNIIDKGETRENDTKLLADAKYWYCGADGLHDTQVAGNYWISGDGSSTNITKLHQMHRDLLHRFTFIEQTPENYTTLNSEHSWSGRLWELEPAKLSDVLKKLQYEGQFIFRLKNDNTPQYIFVPNNPHADHILTKQDISTFQVSDTDFRSITTKYILNFQKHPAESGRYYQQDEITDTTPRTLYNIENTTDNTQTIDFDYLVDDVSAGSNINSSWHNYRKQLFGTVKTIIKCKVINPQFYNMDVGDIVALEDMHIKAFNVDYTDTAFMITSVQRKLGEMDIELREVASGLLSNWTILSPGSSPPPQEGSSTTLQMANQHWKARTMNLELFRGSTLIQVILTGADIAYTPTSTTGISWTPANITGTHSDYQLRATCIETGSVSTSSTFTITPA